ncbi:hypothetical protein ACHAWF_013649 [Thalassiosira exigua]
MNRAPHLLLRRAPSRSTHAASFLGRSRPAFVAPAATTTTIITDDSTITLSARSKSSSPALASVAEDSRSSAASPTSAPSTRKFAEWDGLVNGVAPALNRVRSWPVVGSMVPQLSGIPSVDPLTDGYNFWVAMRNKYGEFYSMGSPVLGDPDDLYRTAYVVNDPREFVKIIRSGGKYPSGVIENMWVSKRYIEERGSTVKGFLERGEEWRRIRTFLQTDLLHPDAARGYLPGIVKAAGLASKGASAAASLQSSGDEKWAINSYLQRCAFDMFSSAMFGVYTETADVTTPTDPENERYVRGAVQGLGTAVEMLFSPYELVVGKAMGFETQRMKHCFEGIDATRAIGKAKFDRFREREERGELSEAERASWLSRAIKRQREEGSVVAVEELAEILRMALNAAVDTTSSVVGWNLCHIARLPDVQARLRNEVSEAVETVGDGEITAEVLKKSNTPFLHALIRETQRLTPPGCIGLTKTVDVDDLFIHGRKMDKGDRVLLESYSTGMNPDLVEDPEDFRPERWLGDAVEARRGTPSEIIDHPFLATPFSQGARKCPGSRVASNEMLVLLARLVLDWEIASPVSKLGDVRFRQRTTIEAQLPDLHFEARS